MKPVWNTSGQMAVFITVGAAALLVRLAFVVAQTKLQLFDTVFVASDSVLYLTLADEIASGHGMRLGGLPTAFVGPGYPLFLAPLRALRADPLAIGAVQAFIGAATAILIASTAATLARRVGFSDRRTLAAAAIAGAGAALYPHLIQWTGYVLTETLFVFLVVAGMWALVRATTTTRGAWALATGALLGCAALTRPPALAVGIAFVGWLALRALFQQPRLARLPLLLALGLAIPVGGWATRNALELGSPVVTSTESGYVFYQGNSRGATGGSRGYVDGLDFTDLTLPNDLGEVERDRRYLDAALASVRDDPVGTVARWPAKFWNMWRPTYDGSSPRNTAATGATYVPLVLFGVLGSIVLARRGLFQVTFIPALFVAVWIALHVLVTGMIRFRLAPEAILLIAAPFGALLVWDRVRQHR